MFMRSGYSAQTRSVGVTAPGRAAVADAERQRDAAELARGPGTSCTRGPPGRRARPRRSTCARARPQSPVRARSPLALRRPVRGSDRSRMRSIAIARREIAHRDGLAGVRRPSSTSVVGRGSRTSLASKASRTASTNATTTRPPRREHASRALRRNARRPRWPPSSWTICIGAMIEREVARPAGRTCAMSAHDGLDRQVAGARAQLVGQLGLEVDGDDVVAPPREVERDAARAGADVEDRPARRGRQLAPERQVGGVAAALDVVPDDVLGSVVVTRTTPCAAPRATSSSRSASIAVYVGSAMSRPSPSASAASSAALEVGLDVQAVGMRRRRTSAARASSAARVPLHVTRRTRPAMTSKSASQTHETSRPSAILSLRTARTSCSPGSSASVRRTSLAPAGFFTSRIARSRPAIGTVSARPKAACVDCRPATMSASGAPSALRQRGGAERVVDVVEAGQGEGDGRALAAEVQLEAGAAGAVEGDPRREDARARAAGVAVGAVPAAEMAHVDGVVGAGERRSGGSAWSPRRGPCRAARRRRPARRST